MTDRQRQWAQTQVGKTKTGYPQQSIEPSARRQFVVDSYVAGKKGTGVWFFNLDRTLSHFSTYPKRLRDQVPIEIRNVHSVIFRLDTLTQYSDHLKMNTPVLIKIGQDYQPPIICLETLDKRVVEKLQLASPNAIIIS